MTHYWGIAAICERLDIHNSTTYYNAVHNGLPVYKRRRPGSCHKWTYSNEALIVLWELAQAKAYREGLHFKRYRPSVEPPQVIEKAGENGDLWD